MPFTLKYIRKPKLWNPILIAGLPGMAQISKLAVEYLIHELHTEKFAELYTDQFPEWVIRERGLASNLKVGFSHCRPKDAGRDFIVVTADAQASTQIGQYLLCSEVLDVGAHHGVNMVVTMAAYALSSGEQRKRVAGVATDAKTVELLRKHGVDILNTGMVVGMNGLLPALAKLRGISGFCLLGPTEGVLLDVKATKVVLNALSEILNFKLDLTHLGEWAPKLPKFRFGRFGLPLPRGREEEVSYIR